MNSRHLFSLPGMDAPRSRIVRVGPDREVFRPEWVDWFVLTMTGERAEGGKRI